MPRATPQLLPIPNIHIGEVYDQRYADAEVHYDALGNLAEFFGRNMRAHRHDRFFQVHYVASGRVRVFLDDQHYEEEGPLFFLTPPPVPHAFTTEEGSDGHVLTVRQQLVWTLLDEAPELSPGTPFQPLCVPLGDLTGLDREEADRLAALFELLRLETQAPRPAQPSSLRALARLLFISLLRLAPRSRAAQSVRHEDLLVFRRFNELIEAHYTEHWPLPRYAERLGVTEARLNDSCRRIGGLPSKRLIHDRLMQEAKRLLVFTGASANEICYGLGFKDPAYFSRFFLRQAGATPGDYRQRHRAAVANGRRSC
ncbi:4-hydroxyphenylacetate catabolism regulatory protein HpaA [Pseudomonas oryzihabitans]|uniref:4-hydroxyphenylacetate catabolism regulatory protein HpaA n=1 Tax=Pseudomonas oryzihabitans TaxID=47885 RepID=UPI00214E2CDF|nr:4-hydroxyphenylacetate catabolism regulatory protein HpaA [Pseudomonas psychrotolerans]UUW72694.1 4-hydroxyphenylacetate catabolism regulatory protein HpaA [Pseudomonas psychrotolerans]